MPHISLNDTNLYYKFDDFGKDEVVVFSNSLGTDLSMWDKQVAILSRHFNILRYDTRGHGKTTTDSPDWGAFSMDTLGKDVIDLMDHLGIEKAYFCGLSMGGLIGQWLGINAPQRFGKIIIANTAAKVGNAEGWNVRIEQVKANGLASIAEGTAERWFRPSFIDDHRVIVEDILAKFTQTNLGGYMACCAAVRDADFRTQLPDLKVPTLVISGNQDPVTTVKDAEYLTEKIRFSTHSTLTAAHLSNVEQAEMFSELILNFIS